MRWRRMAPGGLRARAVCEAKRVPVDSPAHRAGVRQGDILVEINDHPTPTLAPFVHEMFRSGVWAHATYSILRPVAHSAQSGATTAGYPGHPRTAGSIHQSGHAADRSGVSLHGDLRSVSPLDRAEVDTFLCLLFGFVRPVLLPVYRRTRYLRLVIYWANVAASGVQPALFLHFAVSFSEYLCDAKISGDVFAIGC